MKGNIQEILREIKEIESTDKSTLTINKDMINEATRELEGSQTRTKRTP